MISACN